MGERQNHNNILSLEKGSLLFLQRQSLQAVNIKPSEIEVEILKWQLHINCS